jgi:hypothetical protein
MSWRSQLVRPLKPVDHGPLRSLDDARHYLLALPSDVARQQVWLRVMELLLVAANFEKPSALGAATDQLHNALFLADRLDLTPIAPAAPNASPSSGKPRPVRRSIRHDAV